jgi:hypothetical protein
MGDPALAAIDALVDAYHAGDEREQEAIVLELAATLKEHDLAVPAGRR